MKTKLTLGFSPCPNDTFIFDALIHHKIDTEGLDFEVIYEDVETLNQMAFKGDLDITKLSFHAFAHLVNDYALLDAGSALGFGVGPLLIAKNKAYTLLKPEATQEDYDFANLSVAIPGKYTTANFLLGIAFPHLTHKKEIVFSEIEPAILQDEVDLGLIIHENRFTYHKKGLHKVIDLGDYWEQRTSCAIPLGGIVIHRKIDSETQLKVNKLIRKSIEFAFANPDSSKDFIQSHAQEMDPLVVQKHIDLYVNKYSIDLGTEGRKAIETLFAFADEAQLIPPRKENLFLVP